MTPDEMFQGIKNGDIINYIIMVKTNDGRYSNVITGDAVTMYGYSKVVSLLLKKMILENTSKDAKP